MSKYLSNGVARSDNEIIRRHVAQRHLVGVMSEANFKQREFYSSIFKLLLRLLALTNPKIVGTPIPRNTIPFVIIARAA